MASPVSFLFWAFLVCLLGFVFGIQLGKACSVYSFFILVIVIFSLFQHTRLCVVFGVWNVKIICVLFAGGQKDYPNESHVFFLLISYVGASV